MLPERGNLNRFFQTLILVVFWFLIFFTLPSYCHGHSHFHHEHDEPASFKYSRAANEEFKPPSHIHEAKEPKTVNDWTVWRDAIGSTLLISAAPFFILFMVPLDKSKESEPLLKILLSFASGGLLGDAFLHLIPHALEPHSHQETHSHSHTHSHSAEEHQHGHDMSVGISVLFGIITFLLVEKGVRLVKGGHGHSHAAASCSKPIENSDKAASEGKKDKGKDKKTLTDKSTEQKKAPVSDNQSITVSGYLNLAADFTHNITDGLAIGASYLVSRQVGLVTTFTILLHEVPHEIGDFAILIQSGCSRRKAMSLQLVTALGALLGTLISLMAEGAGDLTTSWILPFTAGGFIYISTVTIIPELLEDSKFIQSLKEILAMLTGVFLMVLIAGYDALVLILVVFALKSSIS